MILIYTLMLFLLGAIKHLVSLRARGLERKFVRVSAAVKELIAQPDYKPGNSNRSDPCMSAKRMLRLGQLVDKRDRIEVKYFAWQRWADRMSDWVRSLRDWKGKKLPYTMGAVDVWALLCLVDHFGVSQYLSVTAALQLLVSLYRE